MMPSLDCVRNPLSCWGLILAMLLIALPLSVQAAIDTYEFQDEGTRQQFRTLTEELRCPKCQNQNLADSNSPIAADMRREIHRMLEEGQTDADVVDFMVTRYGEFVRYRPKNDSSTAVLWYGPVALLVIGLLVVLVIARKRKTASKASSGLADNEQQRLQALLAEKSSRQETSDQGDRADRP